ncbi:hypothetical protein ACP0HM_30100 [Escherichia coli]
MSVLGAGMMDCKKHRPKPTATSSWQSKNMRKSGAIKAAKSMQRCC